MIEIVLTAVIEDVLNAVIDAVLTAVINIVSQCWGSSRPRSCD